VPDLGASGGVRSRVSVGAGRARISRSGGIKSPSARVCWCVDCHLAFALRKSMCNPIDSLAQALSAAMFQCSA
jgi:hypothetical protein